MKNYRITVNGITYDVSVEEADGAAVSAPAAAPKAAAPKASGAEGSVVVAAPMPGKILGVKVDSGKAVKKGEVLLILEAMKMENEIKASRDAVVASVAVSKGESVETGTVLVTLN